MDSYTVIFIFIIVQVFGMWNRILFLFRSAGRLVHICKSNRYRARILVIFRYRFRFVVVVLVVVGIHSCVKPRRVSNMSRLRKYTSNITCIPPFPSHTHSGESTALTSRFALRETNKKPGY